MLKGLIGTLEAALGASFAVTYRLMDVQSRALARQVTSGTARTGIGSVVTAAPSRPAMVTGVTTHSPRITRPELVYVSRPSPVLCNWSRFGM